ncbi:hypothetical protein E2C01_013388 [Portunus trituberculatus]|uniref:Uncharacterized protein n=1 Tax=Portunus trituberculatus TaxID=210409 RepID=A0A5B7DH73_PORTR|nr:hypothetical protein [Portunus trituberculatus]
MQMHMTELIRFIRESKGGKKPKSKIIDASPRIPSAATATITALFGQAEERISPREPNNHTK